MTDQRSLLVFNPHADRGRCGKRVAKLLPLAQSLREVEWATTNGPGHAKELAHLALEEGFNRVVALGGDGTVHEAVNGLMEQPSDRRLPLGIVPIGSGNDVAFACDLPHDPVAALKAALTGVARPIDIGRVRDARGRQVYFDNSVGMMFDAAVNIQSRKIRRIYGFAMYLTATIRALLHDHRPTRTKLTLDGESFDKDLVMLTLGNGPREGGGFLTTPDSQNDDGQFELLMVDPISRLRMLTLLPVVMKGKHLGYPFVSLRRCSRIVIETDSALPIHVDGELWAPFEMDIRRIDVELLPAALQVMRLPV